MSDDKTPNETTTTEPVAEEKPAPRVGGHRHLCVLCKAPINNNHESYRAPMSWDMVAAIHQDHPNFSPRFDICHACGEKYARSSG